jgi:hypothetical protein
MRTVVIEPMSEGIDEKLGLIEAVELVVDGIELVSPGAVAALDRAIPWSLQQSCGKTPQVDRRHEHYGGGHVSGIASYKSLCNRVFGMNTKRFPGPRLDPAIGSEKNFGKLYDCSRLTVHFPLLPVA